MYKIIIVYFCSIVMIIIGAIRSSIGVPRHLRDKYSSRSKFAKKFNELCQRSSWHKDYSFCIFYEVALYVHCALFLLSVIIFLIDLITNSSIYLSIGKIGVLIICMIGFLLPLVYGNGITIWWDISTRRYERKMNEQ